MLWNQTNGSKVENKGMTSGKCSEKKREEKMQQRIKEKEVGLKRQEEPEQKLV